MEMAVPANGSASAENAFAMSLKNGYHQLINSISVEITNNQVVNLTNLSNLDINYRLLSSMCGEDLINIGPSIGMSKDSGESIAYSVAASVNGLGEYNNNIADCAFASSGYWNGSSNAVNKGRIQRMNNTSFDPLLQPYTNTTGTNCYQAGKNYCQYATTGVKYFILCYTTA